MIRAFLALPLPDDIRHSLAMQQFLLPLPRPVDPADFHLTLVFLGELPDAALEAAHEAFRCLTGAPFSLRLQGLGMFGGARPHAVWAGVAPEPALMSLQEKAEGAARRAGHDLPARRFAPHITLGRLPRLPQAQVMRLEHAVAQGLGLTSADFPVTEMALFRSDPGPVGRRYSVMATYPLKASP